MDQIIFLVLSFVVKQYICKASHLNFDTSSELVEKASLSLKVVLAVGASSVQLLKEELMKRPRVDEARYDPCKSAWKCLTKLSSWPLKADDITFHRKQILNRLDVIVEMYYMSVSGVQMLTKDAEMLVKVVRIRPERLKPSDSVFVCTRILVDMELAYAILVSSRCSKS